jgi:diadenosine tetraphosphate (Ap4A) HIT family hydrolase
MEVRGQPIASIPDRCDFCSRADLAYILKETSSFLIVADRAPLVEGHILIIPRDHYACYGAVPIALEAELEALKAEVQAFASQHYRPAIFWEHGVFHQTVFHAHLHCFPFGAADTTLLRRYGEPVMGLVDVQRWYRTRGHYFYYEQDGERYIFPAENERYFQVLNILRSGAELYGIWRPEAERRAFGGPRIAALVQRWRAFSSQQAICGSQRSRHEL